MNVDTGHPGRISHEFRPRLRFVPIRALYYNITITGLWVAVALIIAHPVLV